MLAITKLGVRYMCEYSHPLSRPDQHLNFIAERRSGSVVGVSRLPPVFAGLARLGAR
jgi:hypothetical protein